MFRKICIIGTSLSICSCALLPGMQPLNMHKLHRQVVPEKVQVLPTLIPITPTLIADQHINVYHYRIAPADIIDINVWEHPEFLMNSGGISSGAGGTGAAPQNGGVQQGYLVDSNGRIYFPLIGYVHVINKTVDEVRIIITKKLKKYVPNPQVIVRVNAYRGQKIYVLGEVSHEGFLPINDQQLTLADALAYSGWLNNATANPRYIYVIRGAYTQPIIFWLDAKTPEKLLLAEHFSMQPLDILYVPAAPITNFNRTIQQILPVVQTVWFTKSLVSNS